ncbi:hypothetical protein GCM10025868_42100 [Angustibacter aerolatus]|uniref:Glutamine synthetase n=1 Tax=Angustibacter aerolatus TaxID=1162965 RepID=A0ABQ6JQH4_9ACTN|nr:hypothetical protein GCM10025868_42100 [Angustibacter aerolatus]
MFEADMLVKPDPATFQVLPWRGENPGTARMFCDILLPDGTPSFADPRNVLRRALTRAADLGYTFYTHPEIEFFLLKQGPGEAPVPVDQAGYFDHVPHGTAHDFRRQAITLLESMGISVEFSHHEGAPGQNEIDLRYADALTTADNIMTFRAVIKEVALEQGVYATFMPKPFAQHPGSGMHTHLSLFAGDGNAFHEAGMPYQASKVGRQFIAGLLRHAAEITAVTNQWVNYKRLVGGGEAPQFVCWGHNNRSALVRVPMYKPAKGQSTRAEVRSIDSACNPYLAFAVMLNAGLKGIEEGYEPPDEAEDDVWSLTDGERKALGIDPLPGSLAEAIAVMERSEPGRRDARRARVRVLPAQQAQRVAGLPRPHLPVRARPVPGAVTAGTALLVGGTGEVGRTLRPALERAGWAVRVLSRTAGPEPGRVVGDLATGSGLEAAVRGVDAVVHLASDARHLRAVDVEGTGRLLEAARGAGVGHVLLLSIVGCDAVPIAYYRAKVAAEQQVLADPAGSVLRATQFHSLALRLAEGATRGPIVLAPRGLRAAPVDVRDVADRLVAALGSDRRGRAPDLGGPEVVDLGDLAVRWAVARGRRRPRVVRLPAVGRALGAFASGANLPAAGAERGTRTVEAFMTERLAGS